MKAIMVTGALGYIGRHVVAELLSRGHRVYTVDLKSFEPTENVTSFVGNALMDSAFAESLPVPDILLHLAWQDGFKHNAPSHLSNLSAHYNFVRRMVERGCRHVAVMGSMHEVGYHEGPICDDTTCNPLSLYGIAKNALREALFVELRDQPICFQWLRGFYIYGDDLKNHSIFTKILEAASAGKKTFPFTSGKNKYDFISVDELAKMISCTVLQESISGIVNCCSGDPRTLAEVVETFIRDHNLDISLEYGAFPDRPYDSPGIWGNADKIRAIMEER